MDDIFTNFGFIVDALYYVQFSYINFLIFLSYNNNIMFFGVEFVFILAPSFWVIIIMN